ncbi:uncharacterized protein LOC122253926 [Penaeus japonicus]|uniref:uncharacterized protein LOC122253926 n=1 Tax=Penaeus japonicus TaxID=27405 RepID=UPI001C717976|nr:uncharacterized protein LOC122253926 [Penaeus japonicus]
MKLWIDVAIVVAVVTGPPVVTVASLQYYGPEGVNCGLVLSGVYLMLVVVALLVRRRRQHSRLGPEDMQEVQVTDSPPPYETVVAKPPPYALLYAAAPPTADVIRFPGDTSRLPMTYVPVHTPRQAPITCKSSLSPPTPPQTRQDSTRPDSLDQGLPTYQEALRYVALSTHAPPRSPK